MSFTNLRLALALAALAAACSPNKPTTPPDPPGAVACTMDAKVCPDGSSVGRSGPNCEFAACPAATTPADETTPPAAPDGAPPA